MNRLKDSCMQWETPAALPLDGAVWAAWVAKGRAQDRQSSARRVRAVKWVSIAGLLAAAGLWSYLAPFEAAVRFLVTASSMVVMFRAFASKNYAVAAAFGALALFYNPVVPVFPLAGDWQRAIVVVSSVPFLVSLAWPDGGNARTESNV